MPDPARQTVSASAVSALWNNNPYTTLYMLWHHFKNSVSLDGVENERMTWGNRLERAILYGIAEELHLDVRPNTGYRRAVDARLGATVDADCIHPDWGAGAVEAKNVDYLRWRDTWTSTSAPAHIEAQLQCQMLIGDGKGQPYEWGVIGALVGGNDLRLYMRKPNRELWQTMGVEAQKFFDSIEAGDEPDPLGAAIEIPFLAAVYPEVEIGTVKQVSADEVADFESWCEDLEFWKESESTARKHVKEFKARILGMAATNEYTLGNTVEVEVRKTQVDESVSTRKAHVRTNLKVRALSR